MSFQVDVAQKIAAVAASIAGLSGTLVWDPASVAAGAQVSTTVTVTGAKLGNFVLASFDVAVTAGLQLTAVVTANDTVTVTLANHTGGAIDLASGNLKVRVIQ